MRCGPPPSNEPGASHARGPGPFNVVIAGGGVAAIETAIALRKRAGDRVRLTLVAPNDEFLFRPGAVLIPFGTPQGTGYPMGRIARALDSELVRDRVAWVDRSDRVIHTERGSRLGYDALALCLGAVGRPRHQHAITVGDDSAKLLQALIDDVRRGRVTRLAFIVPERLGWPLPLYELALLMTSRLGDDHPDLKTTFITSERRPLDMFGELASRRVSSLLRDRAIEVVCEARCQVLEGGRLSVSRLQPLGRPTQLTASSQRRELSSVTAVALAELYGPHVRGLPVANHGFLPVDRYCRIPGAAGVFAAGDASDFAVKHGGLAAQQGDVVADSIAALAGAPVRPLPFRPVIHGTLLTGGEPLYLTARLIGGHAFDPDVTPEPTWSPPSKVAAQHLGPFLEQLGA